MIRLFKEPDDLYEIAWVELPENFASLDGDLLLSIVATSSRQGTIANRTQACHPSVGSPVVSMDFGTWQEASIYDWQKSGRIPSFDNCEVSS